MASSVYLKLVHFSTVASAVIATSCHPLIKESTPKHTVKPEIANVTKLERDRIDPKKISREQDPEVVALIENILAHSGRQMNFLIRQEKGINNAYATTIFGQRFIVYDPKFLQSLAEAVNTDWARLGVLAHEIGHHQLSHTLDGKGSTPAKELRADRFAAEIMTLMGASKKQAQAYLALMPRNKSATHPGRAERLIAVSQQWQITKPRVRISMTAPAGIKQCPLIRMDLPSRKSGVYTLTIDGKVVTRLLRLKWGYDNVIRGQYSKNGTAKRLLGRVNEDKILILEEYLGCLHKTTYYMKVEDSENE